MKGIIGAICGDIIGLTRENTGFKNKDFELFPEDTTYSDDTTMTLAVASWLLKDNSYSNITARLLNPKRTENILINEMQSIGNRYLYAGYGRNFIKWLKSDNPKPYNSWGNGSAMRVSPVAWVANDLKEAEMLAKISAKVTHNHPEGIKGAMSVASCIYLARTGHEKEEIKNYIESKYNYNLSKDFNSLQKEYVFDISCQGSVPESIMSFLNGKDFEDTIRNAVSLGGDADTQAAISGSIASAYWDVPDEIYVSALNYLDDDLLNILLEFNERFID